MIEIPLRAKDGTVRAYALVDDEDADQAAHRWSLATKGYAVRQVRPRLLLLHREICGLRPGDGVEVDHRDGNGLDCRRSNLRVATRALNAQNLKPQAGGTSAFRGVSWCARTGRWRADARCDGKGVNLGRFDTEQEAAVAASDWRVAHMPFTNEERALCPSI